MGTSPANSTSDSGFLDSKFRYVLFPIAYSIFFIVGFLANFYVLFVLRRLRDSKSMGEIRVYMTNLTLTDLLFVCALPFWIGYYSRKGDWVYNDVICRLTGSFFFINTYGSILFLGAISLNRYWAVTRPLHTASSDNRRRGIIVCIIIWVTSVAMTIPFLVSPGTHVDYSHGNVTRCFEGYQNESVEEKKKIVVFHFLIIGLFFLAFFLVVICNSLIALALLSQNKPRSESSSSTIKSNRTMSSLSKKPKRGLKRKALQMLLAVVGVFMLSFLPHHIVQGPWVLAVLQIPNGWGHVDWSTDSRQAINDAHQVTLCLMGLNCILDPVVYFFATTKFRKFITGHFRKIRRGEACSYTANTQISMESRNNSQRQSTN